MNEPTPREILEKYFPNWQDISIITSALILHCLDNKKDIVVQKGELRFVDSMIGFDA